MSTKHPLDIKLEPVAQPIAITLQELIDQLVQLRVDGYEAGTLVYSVPCKIDYPMPVIGIADDGDQFNVEAIDREHTCHQIFTFVDPAETVGDAEPTHVGDPTVTH